MIPNDSTFLPGLAINGNPSGSGWEGVIPPGRTARGSGLSLERAGTLFHGTPIPFPRRRIAEIRLEGSGEGIFRQCGRTRALPPEPGQWPRID